MVLRVGGNLWLIKVCNVLWNKWWVICQKVWEMFGRLKSECLNMKMAKNMAHLCTFWQFITFLSFLQDKTCAIRHLTKIDIILTFWCLNNTQLEELRNVE